MQCFIPCTIQYFVPCTMQWSSLTPLYNVPLLWGSQPDSTILRTMHFATLQYFVMFTMLFLILNWLDNFHFRFLFPLSLFFKLNHIELCYALLKQLNWSRPVSCTDEITFTFTFTFSLKQDHTAALYSVNWSRLLYCSDEMTLTVAFDFHFHFSQNWSRPRSDEITFTFTCFPIIELHWTMWIESGRSLAAMRWL